MSKNATYIAYKNNIAKQITLQQLFPRPCWTRKTIHEHLQPCELLVDKQLTVQDRHRCTNIACQQWYFQLKHKANLLIEYRYK